MVEAAMLSLSFALAFMSCLFAWHAKSEADRLIKITMEAFSHIKAGTLTEKVLADMTYSAPRPVVNETTKSFDERILSNGKAKDENGNEWEIA